MRDTAGKTPAFEHVTAHTRLHERASPRGIEYKNENVPNCYRISNPLSLNHQTRGIHLISFFTATLTSYPTSSLSGPTSNHTTLSKHACHPQVFDHTSLVRREIRGLESNLRIFTTLGFMVNVSLGAVTGVVGGGGGAVAADGSRPFGDGRMDVKRLEKKSWTMVVFCWS